MTPYEASVIGRVFMARRHITERDTDMTIPSVCLSVCLPLTNQSPSNQRQWTDCSFSTPKTLVEFHWTYVQRARQIQMGRCSIADFGPISCRVSETVQEGHHITMED